MFKELQAGDRVLSLWEAIKCFEEPLRFRTLHVAPLEYARVQEDLGTACGALRTGDVAANIQTGISCFHEPLRIWTPEERPLDYGRLQRYLALSNWSPQLENGRPQVARR